MSFPLTNISGELPKLKDQKIYNLSLERIGEKRKRQMAEPIETVLIRAQQSFEIAGGLNQGRSHWGGRRGGGQGVHAQPPSSPPLQFSNQKRPKVSVLNIRDIDFYGCSKIIRTRNFTIFTVYAIIFGQFMAAFHFF